MKLRSFATISISVFLTVGAITEQAVARDSDSSENRGASRHTGRMAVTVAPFKFNEILVEEDNYRGMPPGLAASSTRMLVDELEDSKKFSKVNKTSSCKGSDVKIDGTLTNLIHKRRQFTLAVSWKLIDCKNGKTLKRFDIHNSSKEQVELAKKTASEIADDLIKYFQNEN